MRSRGTQRTVDEHLLCEKFAGRIRAFGLRHLRDEQAARAAIRCETPAFYYDALRPITSRVDVWETTYYHVLDGPEGVVQWFRGTGLRPFLQALASDEERARFEGMLLERYSAVYPRRTNGKVLFPFRRLFFVAYR